jgi:hypothetical protein
MELWSNETIGKILRIRNDAWLNDDDANIKKNDEYIKTKIVELEQILEKEIITGDHRHIEINEEIESEILLLNNILEFM